MKNIFLLKTDKPTRLHFDDKLFLSLNLLISREINSIVEGRDIYITSDEEIKEGDWMIRGNEQPTLVTPNFFWDFGVRYYKIILTTDPTLIADGVQAIDDEFLEWFVKNPSCESVEVESFCKHGDNCPSKGAYDKQDLCDIGYELIIPKEEPKQDTFEEVAERIFPKEKYPTEFKTLRTAFVSNAKLQAERIYSQDYLQGFIDQFGDGDLGELSPKEWDALAFLKWLKLNNFEIIKKK
jgi:hypothetical protein